MPWYFILPAAFLLVFILAWLLPLPVYFTFRFENKLSGELRIAGVLPIRIGNARKLGAKKSGKYETDDTGRKETTLGKILRLIEDPGYGMRAAGTMVRLARRILRSVKLNVRGLDITYGSGDPYTTAMALGRFYSLLYSVRFLEWEGDLKFNPDFTKKRLEGQVNGIAFAFVSRILLALLLFSLEWPFSKANKSLRG